MRGHARRCRTTSTTTKVQRIIRKTREPWYVTLPASIAQTMGFTKSEAVEWTVTDEHHLVLSRSPVAPVMPVTPELVDVGVKKKSSWVYPIGWDDL
jgi:antitoxin component of MazEF toxin-antitoxin module